MSKNNETPPTEGIERNWMHQLTIVVHHVTKGDAAVQSKVTREFYEKVYRKVVEKLDDLPPGMTVQVVDTKTVRVSKGPNGMMGPGMGPE